MTPGHYADRARACRLGAARELLHDSGAVIQSTHDYGLVEDGALALPEGLREDLLRLLAALPHETLALPLREDAVCPCADTAPEHTRVIELRGVPVLVTRTPEKALAWLAAKAVSVSREVLAEDAFRSLGRPPQSPEAARRPQDGGGLL